MKLLLLSAKILAGIHTGMIEGLQCKNCNPSRQSELNCGMLDTNNIVYYNPDMELELPACPVRFISKEALDYYDRYDFYKIFNKIDYTYDNVPYRFWGFIKEYLSSYDEFSLMKSQSTAKTKSTTKSNFETLKNQFLNKSK